MYLVKDLKYVLKNKKFFAEVIIFCLLFYAFKCPWKNIYRLILLFTFLEVDILLIRMEKKYGILKRVCISRGFIQNHTDKIISLYVVHLLINLFLFIILLVTNTVNLNLNIILYFIITIFIFTIVSYIISYFIENEMIATTILITVLYMIS